MPKTPLPPLKPSKKGVRIKVEEPPKPRRPFMQPENVETLKREARATQEALTADKESTDQRIEELRPLIAKMEEFQDAKSQGLTVDEKIIILEAHFDKGVGPKAIAEVLGRPHSTISRFLTKYKDTSPIAKHVLKSSAEKLAKRVVENANTQESLEVLDRLDVLPRKQRGNDTGTGPHYNIFVGAGTGIGSPQAVRPAIPDQTAIEAEVVASTSTVPASDV